MPTGCCAPIAVLCLSKRCKTARPIRSNSYNIKNHLNLEINMKKAYPKLLIVFYLIPWVLSLFFTAVDCLFNNMYLEWLWLTDWMMEAPVILADIFEQFAVYSSFGLVAHYIFFEKISMACMAGGVSIVVSFLMPFSRYFVRHFSFQSTMNDVYMLDLFYDDFAVAIACMVYAILILLLILIIKAFYKWILHIQPQNRGCVASFRHPVGFSMMLYFIAMALISTVYFFVDGTFTTDAFLSLGGEYLINLFGFVVSVVAAVCASKWNLAARKQKNRIR